MRKPRPSGEYGTSVTPRSAAAPTALFSTSRLEEGPFGLEGGDRVDGVRLAQFRSGHLAQPQLLDLALLDQLRQRADRLGERDGRVSAVHVVEVDDVGAQPAQARLDGGPDVRGVVADAPVVGVVGADEGELGGEGDLVPVGPDERGEELLVGPAPVGVGGVEERDARLQGGVEGVAGGAFVGVAVELAHAHAAEALDADPRPVRTQLHRGDRVGSGHQALCLSGARRAPA
ncbi:hypothetical protein SCALM49S_05047 [Streptomyces californicus]